MKFYLNWLVALVDWQCLKKVNGIYCSVVEFSPLQYIESKFVLHEASFYNVILDLRAV